MGYEVLASMPIQQHLRQIRSTAAHFVTVWV